MYSKFLRDLSERANSFCVDGQIGVLALELMPISTRITASLPGQEAMVRQIRLILQTHGWTDFVIVAHSFGSIFATHLLRDLRRSCPESGYPLVLVDPVTLSIHFAEIPYNFIYRRPKTASQLLCSFAATDIGICPAIMRLFDWTQNVLWMDEIADTPVDVFIAGKDVIIDTEKLHRYLVRHGFFEDDVGQRKTDSGMDVTLTSTDSPTAHHTVVLHREYNHGEIFVRHAGREQLIEAITKRILRSVVVV